MRFLVAWMLLLFPADGLAATVLTYDGSLAGARMIELNVRLAQTGRGYELRAGLRTVGAFSALLRGRSDMVAQGDWRGSGIAPLHVDSEGYWNGRPHRTIVDYVDGAPVIRVMQPVDAERRRALGRDDVAGTVDGLGLIAQLVHEVLVTGRCDAHERVFDGRGITDFSMTTGSLETLPPGAAPYAGMALRCDFATHKLGAAEQGASSTRVAHGYALFAAPAAGLPTVPIRIVFQRHWMPDAVLALTAAASSRS